MSEEMQEARGMAIKGQQESSLWDGVVLYLDCLKANVLVVMVLS